MIQVDKILTRLRHQPAEILPSKVHLSSVLASPAQIPVYILCLVQAVVGSLLYLFNETLQVESTRFLKGGVT